MCINSSLDETSCFYGKTQTGLGTPIQHVLDLAVIINSDDFDDTLLYERAKI